MDNKPTSSFFTYLPSSTYRTALSRAPVSPWPGHYHYCGHLLPHWASSSGLMPPLPAACENLSLVTTLCSEAPNSPDSLRLKPKSILSEAHKSLAISLPNGPDLTSSLPPHSSSALATPASFSLFSKSTRHSSCRRFPLPGTLYHQPAACLTPSPPAGVLDVTSSQRPSLPTIQNSRRSLPHTHSLIRTLSRRVFLHSTQHPFGITQLGMRRPPPSRMQETLSGSWLSQGPCPTPRGRLNTRMAGTLPSGPWVVNAKAPGITPVSPRGMVTAGPCSQHSPEQNAAPFQRGTERLPCRQPTSRHLARPHPWVFSLPPSFRPNQPFRLYCQPGRTRASD